MTESLTEQELSDQGLSIGRFKSLNENGKKYITERVLSSRRIEKLNQIITVTRAVASTSGNLKGTTKSIIFGENPELQEFAIKVVNDYRKTLRKETILEFYKKKYKNMVPEMLSKSKAKKLDRVMVQPDVDLSEEDRIIELANLISQWEHRGPDEILATERDVLERIVRITNENNEKGLTDSDICLAAEDTLSDGNNTLEFPLEALSEENRDELIKKAMGFKEKRK